MSSDPEAVVRQVVELYNALPSDPSERAEGDALRELLSLFDEEVEFIQLRDTRGDTVLVFSRDRLVGRGGVEVEQRGSSIYTVEDGMVVRMQAFGEDHDAARRAFEEAPHSVTGPAAPGVRDVPAP
jgi:hypothetical protein